MQEIEKYVNQLKELAGGDRNFLRAWTAIVLTLQVTLGSILFKLTQNPDEEYSYNPNSLVLTAEAIKLVLSVYFYYRDEAAAGRVPVRAPAFTQGEALRFGVPGLLYAINNNLVFVLFLYVDALTFQVCVMRGARGEREGERERGIRKRLGQRKGVNSNISRAGWTRIASTRSVTAEYREREGLRGCREEAINPSTPN